MRQDAVVIGGVSENSNFSEALIHALLESGFYVIAIGRNIEAKNRLVERFTNNHQVVFKSGELSDKAILEPIVEDLRSEQRRLSVYIHNAAKLVLKPFLKTASGDFETCWHSSVITAVEAARIFMPVMLEHRQGVMIFTGATASLKGNSGSSPFCVAKFGLRALSQSLAREFGPQGIHVAHVIVDGVIEGMRAQNEFGMSIEKCIQSRDIAAEYIRLIGQSPSCWSQEIDLRPSCEKF